MNWYKKLGFVYRDSMVYFWGFRFVNSDGSEVYNKGEKAKDTIEVFKAIFAS